MKNFIYIIEKFPSPTEYFVLNEILELEKRGINLQILVLKKQKKYMNLPELNNLRASILYLPKIYRYFPFFVFLKAPFIFIRSLKIGSHNFSDKRLKLFRDYCIGIYFFSKLKKTSDIHFHAHFAFLAVDIAFVLSKLYDKKYSLTVHANDIYTNISKIKKVIEESAFIITCTAYNRDYLNKISDNKYSKKIHKIYHGIDTSKWVFKKNKRIDVAEINIISVARLTEKKGLIYLLESVKILLDSGNNIKCTIIGEGNLKDEMIDFITVNNLEQFVTIIAFQKQGVVRSMLSESDIFVLPSIIAKDGDRDGLPNVIVEAMSLGLPVISTETSAIPEMIQDGVTGLLVKQKDSLAIVRSINKLIADPKLYTLISENAKNRIQSKLDIEHSTNKIMSLFETQTSEGFQNYV